MHSVNTEKCPWRNRKAVPGSLDFVGLAFRWPVHNFVLGTLGEVEPGCLDFIEPMAEGLDFVLWHNLATGFRGISILYI